jgi:hypothetical protein
MGRWAEHPAAAWVLAAIALAFAAASARPFASSWNDGSRLASVESLAERGTFCIDGSVFLFPNPELFARGTPPYDPDNPLLRAGTLDKLQINGRFYSDKPPLVSLPLAGAYRVLMALGLPRPAERPDVFAWVVCVLLSGTGYAVAVGCVWNLGRRVGLTPGWRLAWLAAFALCTVLPAYTRSANNHLAQLGAVAAVCVLLCRVADYYRGAAPPPAALKCGDLPRLPRPAGSSADRGGDQSAGGKLLTSPLEGAVAGLAARPAGGGGAVSHTPWFALLALGFLTGFAYNLDYGVGPPLAPAVLAVVALRTRRPLPVLACGLAMLPCVATGHAINYAVGGDWLKPLNMHPEYLNWPGSPFATTMTGIVRTRYFAQFLYALDILVGKKGFLTHNPALLLALAAGWLVLRRGSRHRVELLALFAWCAAGWLLYGALSKNHGGWCVSIRWFVPFLAPGFWLLARLLAERPEFRRDFVLLSAWGGVLAASAWAVGTWWPRNVPLYWWCFGGSLVSWGALRYAAWRANRSPAALKLPAPGEARRAA